MDVCLQKLYMLFRTKSLSFQILNGKKFNFFHSIFGNFGTFEDLGKNHEKWKTCPKNLMSKFNLARNGVLQWFFCELHNSWFVYTQFYQKIPKWRTKLNCECKSSKVLPGFLKVEESIILNTVFVFEIENLEHKIVEAIFFRLLFFVCFRWLFLHSQIIWQMVWTGYAGKFCWPGMSKLFQNFNHKNMDCNKIWE